MPSITPAGKQLVVLRTDPKMNHQELHGNQTDLVPGGLIHIDSGPLTSGLGMDRILNMVEVKGTFVNNSTTDGDYCKAALHM